MSDPPPLSPTAWIIRPDELQLEEDAYVGGRSVAQLKGRWRNSLVIVKILSKQAESSVREPSDTFPPLMASCSW
jgi:hypothetical protein